MNQDENIGHCGQHVNVVSAKLPSTGQPVHLDRVHHQDVVLAEISTLFTVHVTCANQKDCKMERHGQ